MIKHHSSTNPGNPPRPAPKLLSVEQTLALLGIGRTTLYHLRRTNALEVVKLGRRSFVRSDDLDAFVASLSGERSK